MEIKFLKAGSGDSILIQEGGHNIIIDGGNDSKYLLQEIDKIYNNCENIDLLIITHHDDDHIKGIIDFLSIEKYQKGFINKVIFNSPRKYLGILPKVNDPRLLSYNQAYELENILIKLNVLWDITTENTPSLKIGNLNLDFLAPKEIDIEKYSGHKDAKLLSNHASDWNTDLIEIERYLDDSSQDTSLPNSNSIVILVTHKKLQYLFTGDITPNRLEEIISRLYTRNKNKPVKLQIMKLPHHGSYRSLSKKILEKIDCENYVISTNSSKYYLPNKKTLMKVIKYGANIDQHKNFYFNYGEALNKLNISEEDKAYYKFSLISNNEDYGYRF